MTELIATDSHSVPGPVTSTPDGVFVFTAEAGVLAVIDSTDPSSFACPRKLAPISSQGVRAVELLLDPGAQLTSNPGGPAALLYVAGGRLGLWAMKADPREGQPMLASRIDTGAILGSERSWCNSVKLITIAGRDYLAALFAHKNCSRLRLYPLTVLRGLFGANYAETGREVAPTADVGVGGNCNFMTPRIKSFGYGMAVDGTDVYIAMGPYGLVRAHFVTAAAATVSDGPYFGTGTTSYNPPDTPNYDPLVAYDDFEFRKNDPTSQTGYVVTRHDPPYFVDVAVQHGAGRDLVWAAVDHLGVIAFDLSQGWSNHTPIAHQEGTWIPSQGLEDAHIQLVKHSNDGSDGEIQTTVFHNYAHRIRIAPTAGGGLAMAVAVHSRPLILSDSLLDEGRTLGQLGMGYQGTFGPAEMATSGGPNPDDVVAPPPPAVFEYTLLYDLSNLALIPPGQAFTYQHAKFLHDGGRHVHLQSAQPSGQLVVMGSHWGSTTGASRTFFARYAWPPSGSPAAPPLNYYLRTAGNRAGWDSYDVSYSESNPELIYMGSTDAYMSAPGFPVTCGNGFANYTTSVGCGAPDDRDTFGILMNPKATWPGSPVLGAKRDYFFGVGINPQTGTEWMLTYLDPGAELCDPGTPNHRPPQRLKRIFVQAPRDRFQRRGRGYYSGAGDVDASYDLHVQSLAGPGKSLAFVSRVDSPAGLWVLDRSTLQGLVAAGGTTDGAFFPEGTPGIFHRELVTHPEFENVYTVPASPPPGFLGVQGLNGRVLTYFPRLMELPAPPSSGSTTRWTLAVPCGAVQLPALDVLAPTQHPEWAPDPIYDEAHNYDHAMVRVFDVHDYDAVTVQSAPIPAYTLLGPRTQSAAVRVEPLTWHGRHFLFVSNFTDGVLVWELTHLLEAAPGTYPSSDPRFFLTEWRTPLSISDGIVNNVWHIAAVNETWNDGQTNRDEVYVYAAVARYGIAVLRFLPDAAPGSRLVQVGNLRTPSGMAGLRIRPAGPAGPRCLLVTEALTGLRVYGYPN